MDAEKKAKWVKALRGGEYKQARNTLCVNDKELCCIGVGAVVIDPAFQPSPGVATFYAAEVLGLNSEQEELLVHMNDYHEKSFSQIADYIEKHL